MAALPQATYSLNHLFRFPYFQTREEFARANGTEAPAFDPERAPKYWFDASAEKSILRTVVYQPIIAYAENGGVLVDEKGTPMLDALVLTKREAATVNIPPAGTNVPGADYPPVPMPLRALDEDEELFLDFGGVIKVRNRKITEDQTTGFTSLDRELLRAVARKLNVPVD